MRLGGRTEHRAGRVRRFAPLVALPLTLVLSPITPASPALLADSPGAFVELEDIAFRPLPDRDGYTQAYSVNYRDARFRIYAVFLISNIGPKSLNNGVSVLIHHNGESRVFTSENDFRTLKAEPGTVRIRSGNHTLELTGVGPGARFLDPAKSRLKLSVKSPQFRLNLELSQLMRGTRLSGGRVRVSDDPADFVRADVPIASATARGNMFFRDTEYSLRGVGGMDSIYTNVSPHLYAKSFSLSRSYSRGAGAYLGVIRGTGDFPAAAPGAGGQQSYGRFAFLRGGRLQSCGSITKIEVLERRRDALSGYTLPVHTRYQARTDAGERCEITERVLRPAGGYSVLGSISTFLRWVLQLLFAKPFILHYETELVLRCADNAARSSSRGTPVSEAQLKERARYMNVQNSFYLVNE